MSSTKRWMLAALMSIILIGGTLTISMGALVIMIMGADSCGASSMPDWTNYYPFLPPGVMILGSLASSILFGLNKRWYWWVGTIVGSSFISLVIAIAWFQIIGAIC